MDIKKLLLDKIFILLFFSTVVYYKTQGAVIAKTESQNHTENHNQGTAFATQENKTTKNEISNQDEEVKLEQESEEEEEEEEIEKAMERPGLFEGDIKLFDGMDIKTLFNKKQKRDAIAFRSNHWPGGVLYYKFHSSLSERGKRAVKAAINHIKSQTCIKFVERTTQKSYVSIIRGTGCYSNIGRHPLNRVQTLSIGRGCEYLGVAVHELIHALGFFHEQSRPDRDKYVTINFHNIRKGRESNFRKYRSYYASDLGAPYDLGSIMHYGRRAFSIGGRETITPKDPTARIGQRKALSKIDVWQLNKLYKCKGTPPNPPSARGSKVPTKPPPGDECSIHTLIDDQSRSVERLGGRTSSDNGYISNRWYRFVGSAGTMLPTMCQGPNRCGANYPGWMSGSHPSVSDRIVTRRVCFASNFDCCRYKYTVFVRNCGKFYVYKLAKPSVANLRYCVSKVAGKKIDCTFDNGQCGFTNIGGDNFDWTRISGSTPSSRTGPKKDYTLKTNKGFYMYIEASAPRIPGHVARLASPMLCGGASKGCIKFAYHMYGDTMGSLQVKIGKSRKWIASGNQGNQWNTVAIPFTSTGCYQVIFEGTRGSNYQSDIAIDDISIDSQSKSCIKEKKKTTKTEGSSFNCNFENGLCKMRSGPGSKFEWTVRKGRTPSQGTGPTSDHTSSKGHYLYTEASSPRRRGDIARIVTPIMTRRNTRGCIQFWYHMWGRSMGQLKVKVDGKVLWEKKGDQGNSWRKAAIRFEPKKTYQVMFESIIGSHYQSDVAIDDLVVQTSSSSCQ